MPWSEDAIQQFETVNLYTTKESDFYGAFNSLLKELFPTSEHYQVAPHCQPFDHGIPDFTILFVVHHHSIPVFFVEVKTLCSLDEVSARGKADDQMRQSISTFGPQFCVYAFDPATQSIDPPAMARDPLMVNDTAPEAQWAYNLLQQAGEAKLREVVNAVKGMAAGL